VPILLKDPCLSVTQVLAHKQNLCFFQTALPFPKKRNLSKMPFKQNAWYILTLDKRIYHIPTGKVSPDWLSCLLITRELV
jgi:hypothetical protein